MYVVLQVREVGSKNVLCLFAVWAIGLGEDYDLVAGNDIIDGLIDRLGHGCFGGGGCRTGGERPKDSVK